LGLLGTAGIGTFTGASLTYAELLEAQTDILSANALSEGGKVSFLCRAAVAALLADREAFSADVPLWRGPLDAGQLTDCPALTSMNIPADTLIAGDFSQMAIAEFGNGLEIRINPVQAFQSGIVGYGAFLTVDVAVMQPSAFSVATSVS
jgi:HK97 family phage major capsid protein